eukprot:scaffold217_cov377-Prasinococcus_capsulatus_cf.AAC.29
MRPPRTRPGAAMDSASAAQGGMWRVDRAEICGDMRTHWLPPRGGSRGRGAAVDGTLGADASPS